MEIEQMSVGRANVDRFFDLWFLDGVTILFSQLERELVDFLCSRFGSRFRKLAGPMFDRVQPLVDDCGFFIGGAILSIFVLADQVVYAIGDLPTAVRVGPLAAGLFHELVKTFSFCLGFGGLRDKSRDKIYRV